jgi:glucokinase
MPSGPLPWLASIGANVRAAPPESFDSGLVRKLSYLVMPPPTSASGDYVLAIDFGGTKVALGTADGEGRIVHSSRIDTDAPRGASQAVERAIDAARSLVERTRELTGGTCAAVAAVSPGVVQRDEVLLAPNVPGWEELALAERLQEGLGISRVEVGNDVKAAALAEARWGSLRGADPAVLLSLGTGVAAGILVGGQVLEGADGAAGEIAYSLRKPGDAPAAAGGRAPLEELVGGRAIGERGSRLLGVALDAAQVFERDDGRARSLVESTLAELAMHVANMAILVNPARIAVGGGLMSSGEAIMPVLSERLSTAVPFAPELVRARFVHDGGLRGAVALALRAGIPAEVAR